MLIIKGVNVFPTQVESVLFDIDGTALHYRIIVERENHQDKATVMVEVRGSCFLNKQISLLEQTDKPGQLYFPITS